MGVFEGTAEPRGSSKSVIHRDSREFELLRRELAGMSQSELQATVRATVRRVLDGQASMRHQPGPSRALNCNPLDERGAVSAIRGHNGHTPTILSGGIDTEETIPTTMVCALCRQSLYGPSAVTPGAPLGHSAVPYIFTCAVGRHHHCDQCVAWLMHGNGCSSKDRVAFPPSSSSDSDFLRGRVPCSICLSVGVRESFLNVLQRDLVTEMAVAARGAARSATPNAQGGHL